MRRRSFAVLSAVVLATAVSGCSVFAVADAAVSVGATAVKAGATVVGAAVDVTAAGVRAATGGSDTSKQSEKR